MPKRSRKSNPRAAKAHKGPKRTARSRSTAATVRAGLDEESHIDGCDVEFRENEATPDADLPAAVGGVEVARARRGRTAPRRK